MKIGLIFGTRPEIIKLSPLMRLFESKKINTFMIHTGQHYSPELDRVFFEELALPQPTYHIDVHSSGALRQGAHIGQMLIEMEDLLLREKPTSILVQGDTNTVLAGAILTSKIATTTAFSGERIYLGHVEAGLRSYDRQMPEEVNRYVTDHLSDYLFAPTEDSAAILLKEGVPKERIFVTGNTIVDAVFQNLSLAKKKVSLSGLLPKGVAEYILLTLHRQENVENKGKLVSILDGIDRVAKQHKKTIIFPIHPKTEQKVKAFNISLPPSIVTMRPTGFLPFLRLESAASLIMTDSGGVQEEACILKVPCVTLRTSTERPETVDVGGNKIAGCDADGIVAASEEMLKVSRNWINPFGDGTASKKIVDVLSEQSITQKKNSAVSEGPRL